jgi:hypothetical protein
METESDTEFMNDADKVMKTLCQTGVVSGSVDDVQCKRKIVELGLTIPEGKSDCLLFGRECKEAIYIFVYFRDPRRSAADQGFIGLRFDCAKYLRNPLTARCGLREACALFTRAVANLTGIELKKNTWDVGQHSDN